MICLDLNKDRDGGNHQMMTYTTLLSIYGQKGFIFGFLPEGGENIENDS